MEEEKIFNETGKIVVTERVHKRMKEDKPFRDFVYISMGRFVHFDWGNTDKKYSEGDFPVNSDHNNNSVETGSGIILASYKRPSGDEIWIKTEDDRSATTILFPDEY